MSSTCPICLLDVRVPVELICFPCSKPKKTNHNHIHCHSVTRVCMTCARTYLERNKEKCNKKRTENLQKQRQELARYKEMYGDILTSSVKVGIVT